MVATIQQIIGKVNPKLYASNGDELLKKYGSVDKIPADEVKAKPLAEHKIVYDSGMEQLEPVYFFMLDLMNDFGLGPQKLIDNFASSPGSGHFSELGQRAAAMQQQGQNAMAQINTILRSVLNLIYDLKEFRMRLDAYKNLKSKDKHISSAARLSLKQIWMDKVDYVAKGNSSIKAMALGQAGFQTLIDAFLASETVKDVDKLDLNDKVKRILIPRVQEFNSWIGQSDRELTKRYNIERTYLRSQVNSLQLYSRWAKPYLKAAADLTAGGDSKAPELVKTFNTILLELTLMGKHKIKVADAALEGNLPSDFRSMDQKGMFKRGYNGCVLVDFKFRGIPQKVIQQQHYVFGGRVEMVFSAYALNDEELKKIDEELDQSDIYDALKLIEGTTTESLDLLQDDINEFLEDKTEEEADEKKSSGTNPFLALIGRYDKGGGAKDKKKKDDKKGPVDIKKDNWYEKEYFRPMAEDDATETAFSLFDIYKKAHQMPSYT